MIKNNNLIQELILTFTASFASAALIADFLCFLTTEVTFSHSLTPSTCL